MLFRSKSTQEVPRRAVSFSAGVRGGAKEPWYKRFWLRRYVSVMSLKDSSKKQLFYSSDALYRSKSFGGFLNSYPSSTYIADGDLYSPGMSRKASHGGSRKGWSFTRSAPKLPKVPRPQRTLIIFDSVIKGLRNKIDIMLEDVRSLREKESLDSSQAKRYDIDKFSKTTDRQVKKLEFHLSKVEELRDNYILQQKLRDGARNMAQAYVSSPHRTREQLNNVKSGFKECTQSMCVIEHTLEQMMGTLHFQMKGVAGFARLCSGDVFEITFRYGSQKWKSKGRVERSRAQQWDCEEATFRCLIADILNIKAVEVKGLGKSVLLGTKNCETKDLFSAHPQIMTVNLNPSGSLKLNVIITWNPLDGSAADDASAYPSLTPVVLRNSPTRKRRPMTMATPSPLLQNGLGGRPTRPFSDIVREPMPRASITPDRDSLLNSRSRASYSGDAAASVRRSRDSALPEMDRPSPPRLEQAVLSLSTTLEDYQGQYPELNNLEQQVEMLKDLLKASHGSGHSSRSSSISISVESALGCFDFLNSEMTLPEEDEEEESRACAYVAADDRNSRESSVSESRSSLEHRSTLNHSNLTKHQATMKTMDSGIESIGRHLSEDRGFSTGSSPEPASIGNEQIDTALLYHVMYCERLLEHLGAFGPLKCREIHALHNLEIQADIIEHLLELAQSGANVMDLQEVLHGVQYSESLVEFWQHCAQSVLLHLPTHQLLSALEKAYGSLIRVNHAEVANKVFLHVISKVVDTSVSAVQRPDSIVTLHQFLFHFKDRGKSDLDKVIVEAAVDLSAVEVLKSGANDQIKALILKTFKKRLPSADVLQALSTLLYRTSDVKKPVASYLKTVSADGVAHDKMLVTYVEALESTKPDVRQGACVALALLKATECISQLTYVCQTDVAAEVKLSAKETLLTLGDAGRAAYEETQLTTHGFQGVMMTKM